MVHQYEFKQKVNVIINNAWVRGMVIGFDEKSKEYMVRTEDGLAFLYNEFELRPIEDNDLAS